MKSYTCPICRTNGFTTDTKFLLFKSPDGIADYCCTSCFDKILIAHRNLIKNIAWEARGRRLEKIVREEKIEKVA